jgi:signal transduction histidine kinase
LSNAIKYGNNEIHITLSTHDDDVVLIIEDNGPGIKNKEAIFELYTQEDTNILERKGQGTGIGLYFLKLLCRDLHIDYTIDDRKDAPGTKFSLCFSKNPSNKEKQ